MHIQTIVYQRTFNLGNYSSEKIGVEFAINQGESANKALDIARDLVEEYLGPLIGKRTWGGLVGISAGAPLVDGGSVTAPSFSIYDRATNEIIAENHGVDPDIDVDNRPDLVADGQDPQLEAAIKYLLQQLDKQPKKQQRTKLPAIGKDGKINP